MFCIFSKAVPSKPVVPKFELPLMFFLFVGIFVLNRDEQTTKTSEKKKKTGQNNQEAEKKHRKGHRCQC